ncbi:MAG TPA: PTS sugar transporter subunit IIC [Nitrospirota bacterium]|nr:PTS sugar transporter subunit IIC [Nitrospirota bacterium]
MPMIDSHMVLAILGVAVIGGIIGLDRTAAGQFMISQPIVAAPFTGWVLGDMTAGMVIGATLELIWVLDIPVGTFVPANATVCAVSATAIAALGNPGGGAPLPDIGFSVLLTAAMVPVTRKADGLIRAWNSRLSDRVLAATARDRGRELVRAQFAGLTFFFLKSFVLCGIFVLVGIGALWIFGQFPGAVRRALSLFVKLLPLLGVAIVVRKLSIKALDQYFFAGFAAAALFGQAVHAPALVVLLLTSAAGWLGARYRERHA